MFSRLERAVRVLTTGLSFTVFGLGGLLLWLVVFPVLNVFVRAPLLRVAIARDVIRWSFRAFIEMMRLLGVLTYDLRGLERLERQGMLVLANHPTLLDTVFLMALIRNADCIVKSKLWNNVFTRGPLRAAGYISNESGVDLVDDCIASLRKGSNLIIFPEGTRTPRVGAMEFKRGAANVAARGGLNVTPVRISCEPLTLGKGEAWWKVPPRRMHFTFVVQDDIAIERFAGEGASAVLAARNLTNYLQDYFSKENIQHAVA